MPQMVNVSLARHTPANIAIVKNIHFAVPFSIILQYVEPTRMSYSPTVHLSSNGIPVKGQRSRIYSKNRPRRLKCQAVRRNHQPAHIDPRRAVICIESIGITWGI